MPEPLPFDPEHRPTLRVAARDLFIDDEFVAWLNNNVGRGVATWRTGGRVGTYSDTFVTYDHGEGDCMPSNPEGMPQAAWDRICATAKAAGLDYCIVQLINEDE